ncbi:hypothetical protein HTT03_13870 [Sulfitobacter sp. S0837]|nr:hypothetical protein [Sulfitobacter maritimus]NUH63766.1 hypothetical protein [Sulfitobacter maritimus]NUH66370.1 hypothetical protein [Sulfitobacter maritimus]
MGSDQDRWAGIFGNAGAGEFQKQPNRAVDGLTQSGLAVVETRHVELIFGPAEGGAAVPTSKGQAVDHQPHEGGISE